MRIRRHLVDTGAYDSRADSRTALPGHHLGRLAEFVNDTERIVGFEEQYAATAALIGGEVTAVFEGLGSAAPYIRSGKARALAVFSAERSPAFPDIPTAAEAGLTGFESLSWYGLWA